VDAWKLASDRAALVAELGALAAGRGSNEEVLVASASRGLEARQEVGATLLATPGLPAQAIATLVESLPRQPVSPPLHHRQARWRTAVTVTATAAAPLASAPLDL
jgi:hypothetical protein